MSRRILWFSALVLLALFLSLTSCAGAREKLVYWGMKQAEVDLIRAQDAAVKDFEDKYNVDVEIKVFPYSEYRDKLLVAAAAGNPPDVAVVDQIWNPEFAAAGFIESLDGYLAKSKAVKRDLYFPGAWDSAVYKGKVYGVPFDVGVWALVYYNKGMFKNAGLDPEKPPVYWDEFLDYGKKLTRDTNNDGVIDQWGTAIWAGPGDAVQCVVDALIFSNGGSILNDDFTECILDSPKAIEALKFYKSLQEIGPAGAVSRTEEDSFKLFTAGKIGMFLYGEWGQDTIKARAPEMDWGLGMFPKPRGGKSIGTFGGWNMTIFKKAKNKDTAWKFIEYWTSREINEKVASLTPANQEAARSYLNKKRRYPDVIFSQLTTALYRPIFPNYPQLAEIQRSATQAILLGRMTVEVALSEATRKINELLKR